jgi:hypothetical protein
VRNDVAALIGDRNIHGLSNRNSLLLRRHNDPAGIL